MAAYRRIYDSHYLQADCQERDQLRNPTLRNRVWATFTFTLLVVCVCQSSVVPRCGRMVGFNAGNYHGVQAVQSGQRCAIAMWYTLDPTHREEAHDSLTHVLASQQAASVEPPPIHGEL